MSFCYAEINDEITTNNVSVYTDTKIGFGNFSGAGFSPIRKPMIEKYGIAKCTICNWNICIAFAGNNINLATKLFKQLNNLESFELTEVAEYAFSIHRSAETVDSIEFIVAYYEDGTFHLDCVKGNKNMRDVPNCYIGSIDAFRSFQKIRYETKTKEESLNLHTDRAFRYVVNGCSDDSVGGFTIKTMFNHSVGSFEYGYSCEFFTPGPILVKVGEAIPFHTDAQGGNYSAYIEPISVEECILNIEQMGTKILYSRHRRFDDELNNDALFGLMLPLEICYHDNQWYVGRDCDKLQ